MKKLFVLFMAAALVCVFTLPAAAQDEPAWNFYGSARMATWYDNLSNSGTGQYSSVGRFDGDDSGTIWDLQSNARLGATVQGDTIGGGFEYGSGPNLRKLYGTYTVEGNEFMVGQNYTPIASMFYSNQAFGDDWGLLNVGNIYNGRDPMLQWRNGGLRIALVTPRGNSLNTESDIDIVVPAGEFRWNMKTDTWFFDVFGAAQTYQLEAQKESTTDDTINSYAGGIGGGGNFGAFYMKLMGYLTKNGAQMGIANAGNASAVVGFDGAVRDNNGFGGLAVLGFKASDTLAFEAGFGYTVFDLDIKDQDIQENDKDDTAVFYVNARLDVAPGFFIVPEFGYYDFGEGFLSDDEGSETYFGAKWQINF